MYSVDFKIGDIIQLIDNSTNNINDNNIHYDSDYVSDNEPNMYNYVNKDNFYLRFYEKEIKKLGKKALKFYGQNGLVRDYPMIAQNIIREICCLLLYDSEYISRKTINFCCDSFQLSPIIIKYLKDCYNKSLTLIKLKRMKNKKNKCIFCNSNCNYKKQIVRHCNTKKHKNKLTKFLLHLSNTLNKDTISIIIIFLGNFY